MLQVNLKLKLSKIVYGIKVSYNTFEKATYDQYLVSSIALRSKSAQDAEEYIDDITGSGSLNGHFKRLLEKAKELTTEQLKDIMNNSMYPLLRIDKSNSYSFYPELNISVFNNKIYTGDFGKYPDLIERLYISEKVIDMEVFEKSKKESPEPYSVQLDEKEIRVKIADEWVSLPETTFRETFINDLTNIKKYTGEIHKGADGSGWFTLTNSVLNNMYSTNNYFSIDGNHYLIRNEDVRKTIVSEIYGFYIYKEEIIRYEDNPDICKLTLKTLFDNKGINEFRTKSILILLNSCDDLKCQECINYLLRRKDSKELSLFGVDLLVKGLENGWENDTLKCFMTHADSSKYSLIYKANPRLVSDIQILSIINPDFLTPTHKKKVEEYKKDIESKIETIKSIVGEVTASGMREEVKRLKANDQTKQFTKLANNYIGHSKIVYEEATPNELDKYLRDMVKMQDLMKTLQVQVKREKDRV